MKYIDENTEWNAFHVGRWADGRSDREIALKVCKGLIKSLERMEGDSFLLEDELTICSHEDWTRIMVIRLGSEGMVLYELYKVAFIFYPQKNPITKVNAI